MDNIKAYAWHADNSLKPLIEELELFPNKTSYTSVRLCDLELKLSHENKGIESIQYYDGGPRGEPFIVPWQVLQ